MAGYLMAFGVYTLAMIGIIFIAFLVWKNVVLTNSKGKSGTMKVEEMLALNSRKSLFIIRVQNERFLIATDVDRTTLLAKLDEKDSMLSNKSKQDELKSYAYENISTADGIGMMEGEREAVSKRAVMRNILRELTGKNR